MAFLSVFTLNYKEYFKKGFLMDKKSIVNRINDAKKSHIDWVMKAKMLIEGLEVNKEAIPVNATECGFGKWFYSDAQKISALLGEPMACMKNIEELHMNLHNIYLNIYKVYYTKDTRGFFSKLFSKEEKISSESHQLAVEYYKQLENISKGLVQELDAMQHRIMSIEDKDLQKL